MRIAIVGAMREEVEKFQGHMERVELREYGGIAFFVGQLHGMSAVLCRTGVGKVNAAMCSQILIDRFAVSGLLFTGVAGALHPQLRIGDVVIADECLQHDVDASALGFAPGQIPFQETHIFPTDPFWRQRAVEAARAEAAGRVQVGRVLSGDQFIADPVRVKELRQVWQGDCVEMEGAAVAQVCYANRVPLALIRTLSDQADGKAPENFAQFVAEAAENSYRIVSRMVRDWQE